MTREEVALRLICVFLSKPDNKIDLWPDLAVKQIRVAFHLADNFLAVAKEPAHEPTLKE